MEPNTPPSITSVRTTKRKLEDAIRTLDGAVVSPSLAAAIEGPTPSKRPNLTRSVYSTLAKFGGTSKERTPPPLNSIPATEVLKSTPHLAAILTRSASQSKHVPMFNSSTPLAHPASEYKPSSMDSFLSRLGTYKITTYANKPPQIDAVAAARCGWINEGKDRLLCGICHVSWVLAGREGMNKDAASALIEKQRTSFVEMHKDGCPWKSRQCEPSIYRIPLQTPVAMVRELMVTALSLEPALTSIVVKHPLTPSQLSSLRSTFSAAISERSIFKHDSITDVDETTHTVGPSETAIVVALFGWVPAPTATLDYTGSSFVPRAGSFGPSASMPPTPSPSRTSSASSRFWGPANSPTPSVSLRTSISHFSASPNRMKALPRAKNLWSNVATATAPQDASLVYCALCQRRVGLWGYSKNEVMTPLTQGGPSTSSFREHQKEFDLVKEHRSYCPYIVCSSVVPSFPHLPAADSLGDLIEGWRAVLTVVQRYELSQRQRLSRFLPSDDPNSQASSAELKGIEAMVAGVKTSGGRELLRYVKALLG